MTRSTDDAWTAPCFLRRTPTANSMEVGPGICPFNGDFYGFTR